MSCRTAGLQARLYLPVDDEDAGLEARSPLAVDIRRQMKEAVAAFATRRHALAQNQPVAFEGQKIGLAPRRVVEMDARGRLASLDLVAEIDQWLEQAAVRGIDIVVVAADLGEAGRGGLRDGALQQPEMGQD